MIEAITAVSESPVYLGMMIFLGAYPVVTALYWIAGSVWFAVHRERDLGDDFYVLDEAPFVSVIVPAHNEEVVIGETIRCLLELDWPAYEIVVVDDGSTDRTAEVLEPFARAGRIVVLTKAINEGKAMALNDAWPLLRGEVVLIVDADGRPQSDVLRFMVPHFVKVPRLAAVTGSPRVVNTTTLLAKVQAIEFTATVAMMRRAQATWGRLMTFSGICTALRRSAVESVDRFDPTMATEDIALAWDLQTRFSDVRYEPRALFAMQVPESFGAWWKQRTRWARGLAQVLSRHRTALLSWRKRRMWPIYVEATLSTLWAHLFLLALGFWALALSLGVYGFAGDPIPSFWGILIATVGVAQIVCGLALDGRYDPAVRRYALWLPLYPLAYWAMTAAVTVRGTLPGLRAPAGSPVTWTSAPRLRDSGSPPERRRAGRSARRRYFGPERRRSG